MSTTYSWPGWKVNRFEIRILPNTRTFVGPYTPTTQVIDLLGERWQASISIVQSNDPIQGAAQEAYFDRLKGPANLISLWHLRIPVPQGTLRDGLPAVVKNVSNVTVSVVNGSAAAVTVIYGQPAIYAPIAQLANTCTIYQVPGRTVRAGDMLNFGGQLVRIMADAVADGSGLTAVEFQPRARAAISAGNAVLWNRPTANFMLKADGVPVTWHPGQFDEAHLDLIEVY